MAKSKTKQKPNNQTNKGTNTQTHNIHSRNKAEKKKKVGTLKRKNSRMKGATSLTMVLGGASAACIFSQVSAIKVAYLGDSGYGSRAAKNFARIKEHGVDVVLMNGDFDYDSSPTGWTEFLDERLGSIDFLATSGNHEADFMSSILHGGAKWQTNNGYRQQLFNRYEQSKLDCTGHGDQPLTEGDYGQFMACEVSPELFVVAVGWDQISDSLLYAGGDQEEVNAFLEDKLSKSNAKHKVCMWHRPEGSLNPGARHNGNFNTQQAYNICAKYGAMVVSGHSHVYGRSKLINDFSSRMIPSSVYPFFTYENAVDATDDAKNIALECGKTISVVNGMGGADTDTAGLWATAEHMRTTWTSGTSRLEEGKDDEYGVLICDYGSAEATCSFLIYDEGIEHDSFTLAAPPSAAECAAKVSIEKRRPSLRGN